MCPQLFKRLHHNTAPRTDADADYFRDAENFSTTLAELALPPQSCSAFCTASRSNPSLTSCSSALGTAAAEAGAGAGATVAAAGAEAAADEEEAEAEEEEAAEDDEDDPPAALSDLASPPPPPLLPAASCTRSLGSLPPLLVFQLLACVKR